MLGLRIRVFMSDPTTVFELRADPDPVFKIRSGPDLRIWSNVDPV